MEIKSLQEDLKTNTKMKVLIYGKSGMMKTRTAIATGRTFLISMEKGHRVLEGASNKIDVVTPMNLEELRESYTYVLEHKDKYDTVVIDSISEISNMLLQELKIDEYWGDDTRTLKLWGELSDRLLKILKSFRDIQSLNVVLIALEDSYEEAYKTVFVPLLDGKKSGKLLPALYDVVLRFAYNEEGEVICIPEKNRAGDLLEPIVIDFDKHLTDFFKKHIK